MFWPKIAYSGIETDVLLARTYKRNYLYGWSVCVAF